MEDPRRLQASGVFPFWDCLGGGQHSGHSIVIEGGANEIGLSDTFLGRGAAQDFLLAAVHSHREECSRAQRRTVAVGCHGGIDDDPKVSGRFRDGKGQPASSCGRGRSLNLRQAGEDQSTKGRATVGIEAVGDAINRGQGLVVKAHGSGFESLRSGEGLQWPGKDGGCRVHQERYGGTLEVFPVCARHGRRAGAQHGGGHPSPNNKPRAASACCFAVRPSM